MLNDRAAAHRWRGSSRRLAQAALVMSLAAASTQRAEAAAGGPDGFGYTWRDGNEPGVTFAWEDISATGLDWPTQFGDDVNLGPRSLSFPFPYYGTDYTSVAPCTNGWLSPVEFVDDSFINEPLPAPGAPAGIIAAFWDDLATTAGISRILFQDFGDRAVITWEGVHDLGDELAVNTFQVVLFPDGLIRVQYLDMRGDRASCTVGIESPDEQDGLTVLSNNLPGMPPAGGYIVEFVPPVPIPNNLDCSGAVPLGCGSDVTGDLGLGQARQAVYRCHPSDFSGREQVWVLDLVAPERISIVLEELGGDPDLLVIGSCNPDGCTYLDRGRAVLSARAGTHYLVVDCGPGEEGRYRLQVECLEEDLPFCGTGLLETDGYDDQSAAWYVDGWFFPTNTSGFTVRVDGGPTAYGHEAGSGCTEFPANGWGVVPTTGPALAAWSAPEVSVVMEMSEVTDGGCCGLVVTVSVTNDDVVPHSFEYRVAHDLTFGVGDGGVCGGAGNIDGGPIEVNGTRYLTEQDLLPLGGTTCEGQVQCFSADHPTELRASYQMLGPNLPQVMEWDSWFDTTTPCPDWSGFVDGEDISSCGEDSALTMIWRFPQGAGMLAPGETGTASYRIGWNCAWPCSQACEDPVLTTGSAVDGGPCNDGIRLSWIDATFPGAGNGIYHVYRSPVSWADALLLPPLTPPAGIATPSFVDGTTTANQTYFYVVQAESLDFPGCGSGPAVMGSTDELDLAPVTDDSDVVGPATVVGPTLRAVGKTVTTVDFDWSLAPAPAPQEHYVVRRADDAPQGPFLIQAQPVVRSWTDPAAPNAGDHHCFFYLVTIADECGNESSD